MEEWTQKAGFPYINITRNGTQYVITQERFLSNGDKPQNELVFKQYFNIRPFN